MQLFNAVNQQISSLIYPDKYRVMTILNGKCRLTKFHETEGMGNHSGEIFQRQGLGHLGQSK